MEAARNNNHYHVRFLMSIIDNETRLGVFWKRKASRLIVVNIFSFNFNSEKNESMIEQHLFLKTLNILTLNLINVFEQVVEVVRRHAINSMFLLLRSRLEDTKPCELTQQHF